MSRLSNVLLFAVLALAPVAARADLHSDYVRLLDSVVSGEAGDEEAAALRENMFPVQLTPGARSFLDGADADGVATSDLAFAVPSADVVHAFFEKRLDGIMPPDDAPLRERAGNGRKYAWYWGYLGRAANHMYRATGDFRFLDLTVDTYTRLLALRDDRLELVDEERDEIVPSWGTLYDNGVRANEVTTAGLITLPVCEFLKLADGDPAVARRYRDEIATFRTEALATLSAFLPEMRVSEDGEAGHFHHMTDDVVEALNHAHAYGAALARCAAYEEGDRYERAVRRLAEYFRAAIVVGPDGAWSWPYAPGPDDMSGPPEAVWKASVSILLPVAAYDEGIAFTRDELEAIVRTLRGHIDRGGGDIGQFIRAREPVEGWRGWFREDKPTPVLDESFENTSLPGLLAEWLVMTEDFPEAGRTVLGLMTANPDMFPNAWFGGARSMPLGLAALLTAGEAVSSMR